MRPRNQVKLVLLEKLGNLVLAECVADSSIVLTPVLNGLVWVSPQQVAQHSFLRHVSWPGYSFDIVYLD